jgi:hypothetical protein
MTTPPAPVLWFDDEWNTEREAGLAPWRRALQAEQNAGRLQVSMCAQVAQFAQLLRDGATGPRDRWQSFKLLIIDVMLTNEPESTYASLGFDEERVIKLDAGAQIAALIRSSMFDAERPDWLATYRTVPMLLLSSSPTLKTLVGNKVGHRRMEQVKLVSKSLVLRSGAGGGVDAHPEFLECVLELLPGVARPHG